MAVRMLSWEAAFGSGLEGCRMGSETWEETVCGVERGSDQGK